MKKIIGLPFFLLCYLVVAAQQHVPHRCAIDLAQQHFEEKNPGYTAAVEAHRRNLPALATQANPQRNGSYTIPVVVHVIHSGETVCEGFNLSVERILSQIEVLNQDYSRTNADAINTPSDFTDIAANPDIQFCLATTDPDGNPTSGITRHQYNLIQGVNYIEQNIKPATIWDSNRYLNIWTVNMPDQSILGYAYTPTNQMVGSNQDGLVLNYKYFGVNGNKIKGRTATHEIGHYLGLFHTWGANQGNGNPIGCDSDDGISDTPNSDGPYYQCPTFGEMSCGSVDIFMNYMDYVDDNCMNLFTQEQVNVMQSVLEGLRSELVNGNVTDCNNNVFSECCKDLADGSFTMGFEEGENIGGWVVQDENNDGQSWAFLQGASDNWGPNNGEGFAVYLASDVENANDYMYSPCVELQDNHLYEISFSYAAASEGGTNSIEQLSVGISTLQNVQSFTIPSEKWIFDNIDNTYPNYNSAIIEYVSDEDVSASIAFQARSTAGEVALQIDDFKIVDLGFFEGENNALSLNGNPTATGVFTVKIDYQTEKEAVELLIYDITGREIDRMDFEDLLSIRFAKDLSYLPNGMYFLTLRSGALVESEKLIIAK